MHVLPFPQKIMREKLDKYFGRFLEVLKQLYVNILFTEVLTQISTYVLKQILSNKSKMEETIIIKYYIFILFTEPKYDGQRKECEHFD